MTFEPCSVRALGIHFDNQEEPGTEAWKEAEEAKAEMYRLLNEHLRHFTFKRSEGGEVVCPGCNKPLTGMMAMVLGYGFRWGIQWGEGNCSSCGWPARAHHRILDEDGEEVLSISNVVLPYHPDFVKRRKEASHA